MKNVTIVLFLFCFVAANAQTAEQKVTTAMKDFHQALVKKDFDAINKATDKNLTYGHSNGWIQNQADVINDFKSGRISYQSFKEDSVNVAISGDAANVRFIADINATNNGVNGNNHLKVLEVYVKKGSDWILFSRQAVR
jgi:ketosteroid isomerase-like protein